MPDTDAESRLALTGSGQSPGNEVPGMRRVWRLLRISHLLKLAMDVRHVHLCVCKEARHGEDALEGGEKKFERRGLMYSSARVAPVVSNVRVVA